MEEKVQKILADILQHLGVAFRKFKVKEQKTHFHDEDVPLYYIDIDSDEASQLIGFHGETIYALQHLLKTLIWKKLGESVFIVLDVDGYRKRQEESVKTLAEQKVLLARKTLQDQLLPPMSSYFRRIVHLYLNTDEFKDVTTESMGEGDNRQITIRIKN